MKQADALRSSERAALSSVQGVVVTSAATARLVAADYGVPAERIAVARPGSDPAPLAQGSRDGVVRLLSVGAVVPRKGFDVLIAALATLTDLPWQLSIAGDRTRDRDAAARLDADIASHALEDRVAVLGAVSSQHLATALCASRRVRACLSFRGLRHGLCRGHRARPARDRHHWRRHTGHGAAGSRRAGPGRRYCLPCQGLCAASSAIAELRRRLASGARAAALQLPTWRQSAEIFARALERLA